VSGYQSKAKKISQWVNHSIVALLWLLVFGVFLFGLANTFVYLFVPVDGAAIWVRQGPMEVLSTSLVQPGPMGLQEGDVVLQIQGHDLDWWLAQRWRTLPGIVKRLAEPTPTTEITIQRNFETQTLAVPLGKRPGGAAGRQFFAHLIVGYAFLIAGIFILKAGSGDTVERVAVLIMALLALVEQNEISLALGAEWAWSMLWLFIPLRLLTRWFAYSFTFHFSLLFPRPKAWLQRVPYLPLIVHLLNPVVTLAVMFSVEGNLQYRHAVAYSPSKNIYIVYLLLACLFLTHSYITAQDIISKSQLRWIAWGVVMAIIPNVLLTDLPILLLGYRLLPSELSSLLLSFVPAVVAVAILRYRLWDIELVIRASLLYGALSVLLGAVYFVLVSLFIGLLGTSGVNTGEANDNAVVFFVSALVVALLFSPARVYLQHLIDRLFFRGKLDYPRLMADLSRALATSLLLDDLLNLLSQTVPEQLGLRSGKVLLDATPPKSSMEYEQLKQGHLVWLHNLAGKVTTPPAPLDDMKQGELWVCAPLLSGDKLLGLYGLGAKKSGEYYDREEIALLETLARQAGVAIQNAQLHEELATQVRIRRELEIARQIQSSLLPSQDPVSPGLEIVGFSRPAQQVGGDFYHYFEFGNERVGIAVGDVSGKGVPAALFMAVSISTLRAQAPHYHHNTAKLLTAMNNSLYSQMTISAVNVAMLYTTIERQPSGNLIFNVSNAGLIWPLLRRGGQQVEYISASGLPIGAMVDASYDEFRLQLLPGDLIILCSDGIIEAMNERQEIFGFERLEQSIADCNENWPAAAVVEHLKRDLLTFVGGAEPHDDMTIVAIRVV
jgi:sigma-B regulation protein RsbU (phosphoserine phosphatase)